MIKKRLYRWLLPRFISKSCGSRIPRSGKRGATVNCYVVAVDRDGSPYFVATSIVGERLDGLKWNGDSYADPESLEIREIEKAGDLVITHYYGLSEVTFFSIYSSAWSYVTKIVYIRIRLYRYLDSSYQFFFNKRKLVTKRRMDLLRLMMDEQLDGEYSAISSIELMSRIYSMRLFLHPSWESQHRKLELYLDSLVDSGELRKHGGNYTVTGRAINTIERYEEEERRHSEAVKLQRKMFWLTIVAVIFAIVQSGVVKLPVMLDVSNPAIEEVES